MDRPRPDQSLTQNDRLLRRSVRGPQRCEALAAYVQATATKAPGYQQWCSHQHEITQRSQTWANAAEGYYWKLGDAPTRGLGSAANEIKPFPNTQKAEDAQQRIQSAVATLAAAGQLPPTATARVKAIVCHRHQLTHPLPLR